MVAKGSIARGTTASLISQAVPSHGSTGWWLIAGSQVGTALRKTAIAAMDSQRNGLRLCGIGRSRQRSRPRRILATRRIRLPASERSARPVCRASPRSSQASKSLRQWNLACGVAMAHPALPIATGQVFHVARRALLVHRSPAFRLRRRAAALKTRVDRARSRCRCRVSSRTKTDSLKTKRGRQCHLTMRTPGDECRALRIRLLAQRIDQPAQVRLDDHDRIAHLQDHRRIDDVLPRLALK